MPPIKCKPSLDRAVTSAQYWDLSDLENAELRRLRFPGWKLLKLHRGDRLIKGIYLEPRKTTQLG